MSLNKLAPESPKKVDSTVERLLDFMNAEYEPEIVKVKLDPTAKMASCFDNVVEKVKRDGGKIHYGWVVWQPRCSRCSAGHLE